MRRLAGAACCVALWLCIQVGAMAVRQAVFESKPITATATIEAIDKANRTVTLKLADGRSEVVKAPDEMEGFNSLRIGDQVSATYLEAVVVRVRKPGDPAPPSTPTTLTTRKDRQPGSETRRDQTYRGTVEAVDAAAPSLRVKGERGVVSLKVTDAEQLKNLKAGDMVDVTFYESLLVKVDRPKKH